MNEDKKKAIRNKKEHIDMELGNLLFGHSRGSYEFPDRDIVDSHAWQLILELTDSDGYMFTEDEGHKNSRGGYEDDVVAMRPYWWGDSDDPEANKPNLVYKPTGFEIMWYKYPFRDSYMNQDLTYDEVIDVFMNIVTHLWQAKKETKQ